MDRCAATTRSGGPCKNAAGKGTDHPGYGKCKNHGGSTANHRKAATRQRAAEAVESLSIPVETTPEEALLDEVRHVAGDVKFLREQIMALGEDITQEVITSEFGGYQAPSVWLDMYWQAHDRLVRVAAATLKAGVEERRVRLAEQQGDLLAEAIRGMLADLGVEITPEVGTVVRRHLEAVA